MHRRPPGGDAAGPAGKAADAFLQGRDVRGYQCLAHGRGGAGGGDNHTPGWKARLISSAVNSTDSVAAKGDGDVVTLGGWGTWGGWGDSILPLWGLSPSVQFSPSVVSDSLRPHGLQHARLPCPIANFQSLLKLTSIESVMPSSHLILCRPLLLLPPVFPSIRVFSNESALRIRWPKYWSFSFSISPSNEHSGLISFRTDWLDLFAVQVTPSVWVSEGPHCTGLLCAGLSFIGQDEGLPW